MKRLTSFIIFLTGIYMQNNTNDVVQELSAVEVEFVGGGFADAWWASNRPMAAAQGLSRWDLYGAA